MLTSKTKEVDEIVGLEVGADDYITKPFSVELLLAHIHSLLRRQDESVRDLESYTFGNIVLDFKKLEASKNGNPITLAAKEFEILKFFILNEGKVVTRDMLLDDVWGYANKENLPTTRTVDSYILVLRKKIEDNPSHPKHLLTVHTKGYKFMK
jgi:DNA-binding response OmpR family regulator